MAGTLLGGRKAATTNKKRYGDSFYADIGRKGGKATGLKGFAVNRELARTAGAKGGKISRRGRANKWQETQKVHVKQQRLKEEKIQTTFRNSQELEMQHPEKTTLKRVWHRFLKTK